MKPRKSVKKSYRKRKNSNLDLVDRISDLPDSILGSILSFLPTKESVATSILSKRWKFVWRNVHNIHFSFNDCFKSYLFEERYPEFIPIVDRVLSLLGVGFLNKFTLDCGDSYHIPSSHVNSWISTAVTRNIRELYLYANYDYPYSFHLPMSVLSCESIRSLELSNVNVPTIDVVCLPRLKILKLISFSFDHEEDFEKLISKCPVLNYLHLDNIDNGFTYTISSTSLKRLELCFDDKLHDEKLYHNVKLKTLSLEYLKLDGFIPGISWQKNLPSLIEAEFEINLFQDDFEDNFPSEEVCNSVVEAVDAFDCVKVLTLSSDTTWALSLATIKLSTVFKRLMKLKITTYCCYRSSLQNLIQYSDNLQVLTIYQCPISKNKDHDCLTWKAPVEVPRCLSNSLKKVEFDCYYDYDDVREMIRFMLKHGSVLEVIKIFCSRHDLDNKKLEFVIEICRFSRKSPSCEVEFSYTDLSKIVG